MAAEIKLLKLCGPKDVLRGLEADTPNFLAPQLLSSAFLKFFSLNQPPLSGQPQPHVGFLLLWAVFLPSLPSHWCHILYGVVKTSVLWVINRTQTWKCESEKMVKTQSFFIYFIVVRTQHEIYLWNKCLSVPYCWPKVPSSTADLWSLFILLDWDFMMVD